MKLKPRSGLVIAMLFLLVVQLAPAGTAWAQPKFKPLPSDGVDSAKVAKVQEIAGTLLSNWASEKFEPLSDAFSDEVRKQLPAELQKMAYQQIKTMFGDYKDLSFAEAQVSDDLPGAVLYRFRGTFSGAGQKPEVRVGVDKDGRVGGFFIKPWTDQLQ